MRKACVDHMIKIAKETDGTLSRIVAQSIEVGVVVPSILKAKLKEAGYSINCQSGDKYGSWVAVSKDDSKKYDINNPNLIARAFSHDEGDALLQAIYSEMKEEEKLQNENKASGGTTGGTPKPIQGGSASKPFIRAG